MIEPGHCGINHQHKQHELVVNDDGLAGLFDIPFAIPYGAVPSDDPVPNQYLFNASSAFDPYFGFSPPRAPTGHTVEEDLNFNYNNAVDQTDYSSAASLSHNDDLFLFSHEAMYEPINHQSSLSAHFPIQDAISDPPSSFITPGDLSLSPTLLDFTSSQSSSDPDANEILLGNTIAKSPALGSFEHSTMSSNRVNLGKRKRYEDASEDPRLRLQSSVGNITCRWAHCGTVLRDVGELR